MLSKGAEEALQKEAGSDFLLLLRLCYVIV
jgi:hypothetical protein